MTNPVQKAIECLGNQENLAKACNVSQNAVSKWLNGQSKVALENALKIEKATNGEVKAGDFNSDFNDLLGRA